MGEEFYFYTKTLSVGYHGVPLVENIEIGLKKGQILTLIGPNGAGKTTILQSIIRQLEPLKGAVFLDGKELGRISAGELARRISVVFTERIRPEMMSCRQVVETGRYPYTGRFGILSDRDHRVVRESMELVKVSEIAEEAFEKISDGQRQRVMLARALSQEPELIVLDEPTSFLDIRHKLEFLSVLQRLSREKGLSVFEETGSIGQGLRRRFLCQGIFGSYMELWREITKNGPERQSFPSRKERLRCL